MAMKPFVLRANLIRGVVAERYSLDLAGILASRMVSIRKDQVATANFNSLVENPRDLELPLDICDQGADNWHWAVTTGVFKNEEQEPRMYYRVVNDSWAGRAADRPLPAYNYKSGAYRDIMLPAHVVLTPWVEWYGMGDLEGIEKLVAPIRSIGKRRAKGEGVVRSWELHEHDAADKDSWIHCGPTGDLQRPSPVECAQRLHVEYELAWHAIRPPSWNPNRIRELAVKPEEQMYLPEEWEL